MEFPKTLLALAALRRRASREDSITHFRFFMGHMGTRRAPLPRESKVMMSNAQAMPIVGVFENHREASGVFLGLLAAGFPRKNIAIAARSNWIGAATGAQAARASGARGNTATASARHGALAALGIVSGVVPAIGSVIAAGALRVVVTNPTGATDLVTALIDAGLPAMKARYYRREVEAGRLIMMIDAGARADDAIAVLRSQRPFAESSPFPTMWG